MAATRRSTTRKSAAKKKSSAKKSGATERSSKRTLIAPKGDKRYVRRSAKGKFTESDDVGRSLSRDVKKKAKRTVKSGQGDKGDQKRSGGRTSRTIS